MTACDYCDNEFNVVYICKKCSGSFCSKHKSPDKHECSNDKVSDLDGLEISVDELVVEESEGSDDSLMSEEPPFLGEDFSQEPEEPVDKKNEVIDEKPGYYHDVLRKLTLPKGDRKRSKKQIVPFLKPSIILVAILWISVVFNGFLYFKYQDYVELNGNYVGLYNTSNRLQSYYDNLTSQYMELREEYSQLNEIYGEVIINKAELESEYFDILNYRKGIQLVKEKTITLLPNKNYTEIHEVPFSGYIFLNYSATGDVYTWVGSSSLEKGYYSRYPQFPETSSSYNFTVPVLPDILIYLANPNGESVEVTYWVHYTY